MHLWVLIQCLSIRHRTNAAEGQISAATATFCRAEARQKSGKQKILRDRYRAVLRTESDVTVVIIAIQRLAPECPDIMPFRYSSLSAICLTMLVGITPALAQNEQADKAKQQAAEQAKKEAQRINDLAEVSKQMSGPAGNPECVWVGRRVVHRLFQDDLDTAFRHMDLYDRFGCPGGHIQAAFRCVVQQGPIVDPKAQENILARVHSCWVNPAAPPSPAAAATTPQTGTTTQ